MLTKTWLDYIPLWVLFAGTVLLVLAAIEGGYRLAVFRKRQSGIRIDAPIGSVIGGILGLVRLSWRMTSGV